MKNKLIERSGGACEMCGSAEGLEPFVVSPKEGQFADECVLLCDNCKIQIDNPGQQDANHWRCLNDSMWSEVPAVKVVAWRMLHRLRAEGWPQDLLDMMYLDDETKQWAEAEIRAAENAVVHLDSNGAQLQNGDNVVLTQDLNVKGGGFTAKRGTAVRNIRLVQDNAEQIEGKVNGQQIVILTKFVKK